MRKEKTKRDLEMEVTVLRNAISKYEAMETGIKAAESNLEDPFLKPCPMCKSEKLRYDYDGCADIINAQIECLDCGIHLQIEPSNIPSNYLLKYLKIEVIRRWNTR